MVQARERVAWGSVDTEDTELIRRVSSRDRAAFEQLYLKYHRRLARFLMRFARHYDAAEEIINDTMHVVWDKSREFAGASKVSTWIFGIAYRRAMKTFERLDRHKGSELPEDAQIGEGVTE